MMPVGRAFPQMQLLSCLSFSLVVLCGIGVNSQFIFFLVLFVFLDRFLSLASKLVLMVAETILITDTGG